MLTALEPFEGKPKVGMFINSCFAHCQSELQDTWFAPNSPRLRNKVLVIYKNKLHEPFQQWMVLWLICWSFRPLQSWSVIGTLKGVLTKKSTVPILVTQLVTTLYHLRSNQVSFFPEEPYALEKKYTIGLCTVSKNSYHVLALQAKWINLTNNAKWINLTNNASVIGIGDLGLWQLIKISKIFTWWTNWRIEQCYNVSALLCKINMSRYSDRIAGQYWSINSCSTDSLQ